MNSHDQDIAASLREWLTGRVCIVGVGNRQRGDDGTGPRLIDAKPSGAPGVWLDTGVTPENFLEPLVRTNPNTILIVDAVAFDGLPGECRLLDATELHSTAVSTHAGSLHILSEYLSARTGACIRVLAIQPQRTGASEELSQPVEKSVVELAALLSDILTSSEVQNAKDSSKCGGISTLST